MRRGRLPARCCCHHRVDGLQRPSGRNATPCPGSPPELTGGLTHMEANTLPAASVQAQQGLETFPLLDRESRRRRQTDEQLSYAMYLVLGFFTFGIYSIYVHFKLIARQQE